MCVCCANGWLANLINLFRFIRPLSSSPSILKGVGLGSGVDPLEEGLYTADHMELRASLNKLIEKEINPYVDEWEEAKFFPAQKVRGCGLKSERTNSH